MNDFHYLKELNPAQQAAVEYIDGPSLVVAGAGSGKTRVLTYKVAYLLHRGLNPSSILALTFTNKAAREMKSRIASMVGDGTARYLWMGTFHSIFSRILRSEAQSIGYSKNFSVYDSADSKNLIKTIIKELNLDDKIYKPGSVMGRISGAKNNLITPQSYSSNTDLVRSDSYSRTPLIKDIYAIYANRCKQADAMDFDDLLLQTNLLFRDHPDVLAKYQNMFSFILVDEYQDTNFAQYMIVKKLGERHQRVCVVGDDAQSIYSFRGADIGNILSFRNNYKGAKEFKLEQNYRSTQTIVNAANSVIFKNNKQIQKNVFSEKEIGKPIKLVSTFTDFEEGFVVANNISDLKFSNQYQYKDIAILYRTNSQSRVLEEALRKQNIPYRIYGGLSFYQRKEIKDVIAYCRLVCNPSDEEALKRIINYPTRGIGDTTINKIVECSQLHAVSMWDVIGDILKFNLQVNAGTASKLTKFRQLIEVFTEQINTLNAYELATSIVKLTGVISDTYTDRSVESMSRQENVQELLKAIHEYTDTKVEEGIDLPLLPDFLSEVSLLTDQDTDNEEDNNKITLMTVHAAKGLEFKAVFIVGMEEELFPSAFSQSEKDIEEERRLFYVAITRAEERCFISYAKSRFRNGKTCFCNPSRFIQDIDSQYLDAPKERNAFQAKSSSWDDDLDLERSRFSKNEYSERQIDNYNPTFSAPKKLTKIDSHTNATAENSTSNYKPGTVVRHSVFGIGSVISSSNVSGNEKVEIDFGTKGVKSLLLKFAKLEVVE